MRIGQSTDRIIAGLVDATAHTYPVLRLGGSPCIYMHSAASDASELMGVGLPAVQAVTQMMVDTLGFNAAAVTATGSYGAAGLPAGSSVGAAAYRGVTETLNAFHVTSYQSSGPTVGWGVSMGTSNLLVHALEHPGSVKLLVLFSPVPLLKEYEAADTQSTQAAIDTGWNVSAGNLPSNADLYTRITGGGLAGVPVLWIGSSDDPYSTGSFASKYADVVAATGGYQQALGAVGHGNGTVAAADLGAVAQFIRDHS